MYKLVAGLLNRDCTGEKIAAQGTCQRWEYRKRGLEGKYGDVCGSWCVTSCCGRWCCGSGGPMSARRVVAAAGLAPAAAGAVGLAGRGGHARTCAAGWRNRAAPAPAWGGVVVQGVVFDDGDDRSGLAREPLLWERWPGPWGAVGGGLLGLCVPLRAAASSALRAAISSGVLTWTGAGRSTCAAVNE